MQPFFFFYFAKKQLGLLLFFWMLSISGAYVHARDSTAVVPLNALPHLTKDKPSGVDKQLIYAIQENNLQQVTALLHNNKNINHQDFLGYSPLHYAAKRAKAAIVASLIEAKALLNQCSVKNENTPLLLAVKRGDKKIVSLLLAAGANPNIVNRKGYDALQLAIQQNRKDLVQLLLQAGATTSTGVSPLLLAIKRRSLPIVQLLLQQKEMVETRDKEGYTELHWAAKKNVPAVFRALLKSRRFNVNAKADNGATPLHIIAANKKSKLVKTLLACPLLEVNVQDSTGSTPLHYAAAFNHLKAVNGLLCHPSFNTKLHNTKLDNTNLDNTNLQNHLGETALHYAVQCQHLAIVKKLLPRVGKGVYIQNKKEVTPLELAAMDQNDPAIYNLILAHVNLLGVD